MKIFAVKDKRTNHYKQPMFFKHAIDCIRVIDEITNNKETDLHKWAMDFQLDQLGTFDEKTGAFLEDIMELHQIIDLKRPEQQETLNPKQEEARKIVLA